MDSINSLAHEVRDLFLDRRGDLADRRAWYRIVAALDSIGDTALACESYEKNGLGETLGDKYLCLYGLLQAIFLQQDSASLLHKEVLGREMRHPEGSASKRLRTIRNQIAGHPGERAGAVSRISIKDTGFRILYWNTQSNGPVFEDVDLEKLYEGHKVETIGALRVLKGELARAG